MSKKENNNPNLNRLFYDICKKIPSDKMDQTSPENMYYNPDRLIEMVDSLEEYLRDAVVLYYGIASGSKETFKNVGEKLNISPAGARVRVERALIILSHSVKFDYIIENERKVNLDTPIKNLELSTQAFLRLARADIKTVRDLINQDEESLRKIRNIGTGMLEEILTKINELYDSIPEAKEIIDKRRGVTLELDSSIKHLNLSPRVCNALVREGIVTIGDLLKRTSLSLSIIRNIGKDSLEEISVAVKGLIDTYPEFNDAYMATHKGEIVADDSIRNLDLTGATKRILFSNGIETVEQLIQFDRIKLRNLRGIGEKAFSDILKIIDGFETSEPKAYSELDGLKMQKQELTEESRILQEKVGRAKVLTEEHIEYYVGTGKEKTLE